MGGGSLFKVNIMTYKKFIGNDESNPHCVIVDTISPTDGANTLPPY